MEGAFTEMTVRTDGVHVDIASAWKVESRCSRLRIYFVKE